MNIILLRSLSNIIIDSVSHWVGGRLVDRSLLGGSVVVDLLKPVYYEPVRYAII